MRRRRRSKAGPLHKEVVVGSNLRPLDTFTPQTTPSLPVTLPTSPHPSVYFYYIIHSHIDFTKL